MRYLILVVSIFFMVGCNAIQPAPEVFEIDPETQQALDSICWVSGNPPHSGQSSVLGYLLLPSNRGSLLFFAGRDVWDYNLMQDSREDVMRFFQTHDKIIFVGEMRVENGASSIQPNSVVHPSLVWLAEKFITDFPDEVIDFSRHGEDCD